MIAVIVAIVVLAAVTLPQLLVRTTISRHAVERPDLPGTGGELARHLLDRFDLGHVKVEITDKGDHYDPDAAVVRLLPQHHDGRSLSAVAIAAHEVSHAIQHGNGERKLALRQRLAKVALFTDRIAGIFFIAAPVLTVVIRSPAALAGAIAIGIALLSVRVVVNLVTLPVETDASFAKALPILKEGGYLSEDDLPAAQSVLRAAAFTYVAGALISLINLARWIRLLR
ncbi:zinc metallopeptidase [Aquibium sp. ELW1220]|jgi:Zn-dependent membrane protease YugP|uniref:zinc metallopeptidase n=1 Tax=Aquibium sp. ELW1220 TaxID=2976766 RepID=UPI0025B27415|nr:zinc metallopeptidase [Aquibium sp. ELW1220]MDN2580526.1 zinc metallopeptidase [Aquibium sp. ELW1220]